MSPRISVDSKKLVAHVNRICKRNLKKPAKICLECPFITEILKIMEDHGWEYNKQAFKDDNGATPPIGIQL